jgi:AcrR family transcriptional regulator
MTAAVKGSGSTRRYTSTLRDEGALRTQRAITEAATALFVRDGYAATSLAAIAKEAGCARPTVFAVFGSKAALLRQVLDEALAGDDEPMPVAERPWFQPVWTAQTVDELITAYADVCVAIARRSATVFEVVRRAVDADREIRGVWQEVLGNRRAGARMIVDRAVEMTGSLPAKGKDEAVDLVWFANDPAHYAALVGDCRWSEREFQVWLTRQITAALRWSPGEGSVVPAPRSRRVAR